MKIYKYNVGKEGGESTSRISSSSSSGSTTVYNSESAEEAKRLKETHLIFGQPFNGTADVSGDITNAQNITTEGGNITVKKDGEEGGNIIAEGYVKGVKFIGDVEAGDVVTNTLKADSGAITSLQGEFLDYDSADIREALIEMLSSVEITTEKLTVTKQAHFFELIIDKIKAAGGAILLSPADGFKVDRVINIGNGYRLLWKKSDGEKARSNMWKAGDQAICQTFNAAEGTSYNVSNKYYWALVLEAGSTTMKDDGTDYNYIDLSNKDYDGTLNPEANDEVAMLGYRGSDDKERQSAIYLAAYNSIDPSLKAPLICQYKGINDFNLKSHKYTFFAANGSEVRGNIKMESGEALEDYIDYRAITIISQIVEYAEGDSGITAPTSGWSTKVPFIPPAKYLWTRTTVTYSDGTKTVAYSVAKFGSDGKKGDQGADGNSYSGNLLMGTRDFSGEGWQNVKYWIDTNETYLGCKVMKRDSNNYGIYQDCLAEEGATYTFSAYVKSDGGDIRYYFEVEGGADITPQMKDIPESNEWERIAVVVKCNKSGVIRCRVQKATGTGTIYVAGYKLERGENPNAVWTPEATEMIGTDAEFYKLEPLKEYAEVDSSGNLNLDFRYQIIHIVGNSASTVTATSGGYYVRLRDNTQSSYINLSYSSQPSYIKDKYLQQYQNNRDQTTQYFEVQLMNGSEILDRRIVTVTLAAAATLEITDRISSRVQGTESRLGTVENNVSTLTQTASSLQSTVSQHTSSLNNHTTRISNLEQTAEGLTSVVEEHKEKFDGIDEGETVRSIIKQTADKIQLQVDEISLKIDNRKIQLNGNTEVNGTVNINQDGTGFRLNGSKGETFTIGSNDIGTYSNFENKTVQNWWHTFNTLRVDFASTSQNFEIVSLCSTLKAGQRLRITNLNATKRDYSSNASLSQLNVSLCYGSASGSAVALGSIATSFSGGSFNYQGTSAMNGSKAAIIDYTASQQGDYYLKVTGTMTGTKSGYTELFMMLAAEISLSAFGNLTYNGFGFNFGAGKVAFIGSDSMTFKMGSDSGLKITAADGLQRLVPESHKYSGASLIHYYVNSGKWIGTNDYIVRIAKDLSTDTNKGYVDVVSPKDEMIVVKAITYSLILLLPSPSTCAGKSYIIKNRSSSDNLFVASGALSTTNAVGDIIAANSNVGYNDSCGITYASGTTTYRGLMKCSKNSLHLVSDGEKWINF